MPQNVYDGLEVMLAQDGDSDPSYIPSSVLPVTVNRTLRGAKNRTRPPLTEMNLVAAEGEDPAIVDTFQAACFQGAYAYLAVKYNSNDGFAVAAGGTIYFIVPINNTLYVSQIMTGNDPSMMHTWFVQAEDWLYVQNGRQNAIAWDGDATVPAFRLNPVLSQMPIGTIMEYIHGRVFVSDINDNIFASDIIYGNGFTTTSNTQNFTETDYWQEGGSFNAPSNLGRLTGMKAMPSLNQNDTGKGELVFTFTNGFFILNPQIPRDQWKDAQMQRVSLIGRGNYSPWSLCSVNNEIFFRADDGWAAYSNSQIDFANRFTFRKLSREVNLWVNKDTNWLRQFASAMFFDNRLLMTVSPYLVPNTDPTQGLHRPHRGMVILDLDQSAEASPDAQLKFRWNGLWTGPQPTQFLKANIRGQERAFIFSFDRGKNRIYELQTGGTDDWIGEKNQKIKSYFLTKRFSFSDTQSTNRFLRKKITGGDFWLSDIRNQVSAEIEYRPDNYPCWNTLMNEAKTGCNFCDDFNVDCSILFSQARFKRWKFPTPQKSCQIGQGIGSDHGAEFQLRVMLEGHVTVDRLRLMASLDEDVYVPVGDSCEDDTNCQPIDCCPIQYFEYYNYNHLN